MQVTLVDIQKNIALLSKISEPLYIMDEQRKQIIASAYPRLTTKNALRLAGKYQSRIPAELKQVSFEYARETAMKEKYGTPY